MKKNTIDEQEIINPVEEAIERCGGNQTIFAQQFGITQQTVSKWVKKRFVPPARVFAIEKVTGIPRHRLNPDFFSQEAD